MKALVIDDSRAMRLILRRTLKGLGYAVEEAPNGQIALEILKDAEVDVVLVDWNMPVMNGYEFIKAFRSDESNDGIPVLMVTSESDVAQVDRALQAGANEYVMKPFDAESIREKLELVGVSR